MIADLLRVQALIFLATPFVALPEVLLIRELDFRRPALVNLAATAVSAAVALGGALAGFGVWTLVYAPIAFFWSRAIGLTLAARLVWPSFGFAGAGRMIRFGLVMLAATCSGRWSPSRTCSSLALARAHQLGLYAEALFLTTIITGKFVPPLNEVAFPAYSRLQDDLPHSASFLKAVRLIMLVTCPLYVGLAVIAGDAVTVVLGAKWAAMAPLVSVLALAMPAMTLHILFAPALNAVGQPRITMQASLLGAAIMPLAFLAAECDGARRGSPGPGCWRSRCAAVRLPARAGPLAITAAQLGAAIAPALGARRGDGLAGLRPVGAARRLGHGSGWCCSSPPAACLRGDALRRLARDTARAARLVLRRQPPAARGRRLCDVSGFGEGSRAWYRAPRRPVNGAWERDELASRRTGRRRHPDGAARRGSAGRCTRGRPGSRCRRDRARARALPAHDRAGDDRRRRPVPLHARHRRRRRRWSRAISPTGSR